MQRACRQIFTVIRMRMGTGGLGFCCCCVLSTLLRTKVPSIDTIHSHRRATFAQTLKTHTAVHIFELYYCCSLLVVYIIFIFSTFSHFINDLGTLAAGVLFLLRPGGHWVPRRSDTLTHTKSSYCLLQPSARLSVAIFPLPFALLCLVWTPPCVCAK